MQALERLIDADTFLTLERLPEYLDGEYELINGEMIEMVAPGIIHGDYTGDLYFQLRLFLREHDLGKANFEVGYCSVFDRFLVLRPDVAFISHARAPAPDAEGLFPRMPDLAVEVASPSNTVAELREKADIYLRNETQLVWLVFPQLRRVEVIGADGAQEILGANDTLTGGDVLPGFSLDLSKLFS